MALRVCTAQVHVHTHTCARAHHHQHRHRPVWEGSQVYVVTVKASPIGSTACHSILQGYSTGLSMTFLFPDWLSAFLVCQHHHLPMEEGKGGYTETVPMRWQKVTEPQCIKSKLSSEPTSYLLVCWLQKICFVICYELPQSSGRKVKLLTVLTFEVCKVNYLCQDSAHSLEKRERGGVFPLTLSNVSFLPTVLQLT